MLPFGHIAAGYLLTDVVLAAAKPSLSPAAINSLIFWGTFFAFAPDLDMFYAFFKAKAFIIPGTKINHRDFLTHRPILWLAAALIIMLLAPTSYWRWFGLVVWLGSWSHFVLDSLRTGVRWLWPFKKDFYALKDPGAHDENPAHGFFSYWINMIRLYEKKNPLGFYLEIIIIILAIFRLI